MRLQQKKLVPVLMSVLILAGFLLLCQAAQACMTPVECYIDEFGNFVCTYGGSVPSGLAIAGETKVTILSNHKALIQVGTYATPEMTQTYNCAAVVPPIPGIRRVDRMTPVDAKTGGRRPHF